MAGRAHPETGRVKRRYRGFPVLSGVAAALALVGLAVSPTSASASGASASGTSASGTSASGTSASGPMARPAARVVNYHGYRVKVPASWPVHNLAADPGRCVLFNTHAVYLGTPGTSQHCPARAFGRTEALLIQSASAAGVLPKSAVVLPRGTAALPTRAAALPAAATVADATGHVIQVEASGPGVVVTATYGRSQAMIRGILAGATMTAAAPATATSKATATATAANQASGAAAQDQATAISDLAGMTGSGLGFDTCTAPSVATMADWLASPYRVMGTYLGGVNWACSYGNFNASWVNQVAAEGWRFIPIWVGPQAPCSGIRGATLIDPSQAAAEGQAEAADAVATAQGFGYGSGTPIYFDMEGYSKSSACSQAVLAFLGGWTQGLHAAGYLSGVYSSAGSGIVDLASEYGNSGYTSPDDVWIADWDGNPVLSDPFLPDSDWLAGQRLRQYAGSHDETWGGDTLNVDSDAIGGPVAGLFGAHADGGPGLLAGPDAVTVPAGGSASVRLTLQGTPTTPAAESWQATAPAGITVTPASGSVVIPPGRTVEVQLTISPSASLAAGRYDVPVTISTQAKAVAETFELVSVTPPGSVLPTAHPIVLYAADTASMADAEAVAQAAALPASDVTGSFSQAWSDLTSGKNLVIAVGQAAVNGLFYNACGWANPAGEPANSTPFFWLGSPFRRSPGADIYEPADGTTDANTALLTSQLTHYALAGTLPDYGRPPTELPRPTDTCLGSPDVTAG